MEFMAQIWSTIVPAGFIVTDNELIYGVGATEDMAWADMLNTMAHAGIRLLSDDDDSGEEQGSWVRESGMTIRSATAQLMADVDSMGGAIGWREARGIACTLAEYEEG